MNAGSGFDTVLIDLDGTLIDESPNVTAGYAAAAEYAAATTGVDPAWFGRVAPGAAKVAWWEPDWLGPITERFGLSAWDGLSEGFPGSDSGLGRLRRWLPEYRRAAWLGTYERCGLRPNADIIDGTCQAFIGGRHAGSVCRTEGANDLLRSLADSDIVVVTNGPGDGQRAKAIRAGLGALAPSLLASTEAGTGKPDPQMITIAVAGLPRRDARRMVVIGDSYDRDIQMAVAFGCPSIWIAPDAPQTLPAGVTAVADCRGAREALTGLAGT